LLASTKPSTSTSPNAHTCIRRGEPLERGCTGNESPPIDASTDAIDASSDVTVDVGEDVDKSATCASQFGSAIGSVGFARFDGTVVAVVADARAATFRVLRSEF
jgi:hypothetical protein